MPPHSHHESLVTVDMAEGAMGRESLVGASSNIPEEINENGDANNDNNTEEQQHEVVVTDGHAAPLRQGTISSALFNILCTMVGGGCLSLPMAFQKTGNGLFGPFLLILTALITEFCFRIIITSVRHLSPVRDNSSVIGKDSFETIARAAFGTRGFLFAKW
jgi:hypothetical protein